MSTLRSYSKLLAYEASRILFRLGCDVRVYDPSGLPVKDDQQHDHPKVQELRELSKWSDGHIWVSPEQHGALVCPPTTPGRPRVWLKTDKTTATDWCFQEPDRLDPTLHWQRPTDAGKDAGYRASQRWLTVLQRSELATHPGPLDEDVHHPESELYSTSLDALYRRRRSGRRRQPSQSQLKQEQACGLHGGVCKVYHRHAAAL